MKAGMAFALAASQPIASEVRFVLREAIDIAASCRVGPCEQAQFLPVVAATPSSQEVFAAPPPRSKVEMANFRYVAETGGGAPPAPSATRASQLLKRRALNELSG
jgi:hypothetical protein